MEPTTVNKKLNGSKWIRPEKRLAIYIRDDFRCAYCGEYLKDRAADGVTLDHLVARNPIVGPRGANEADNLVTACKPCNSRRGNKIWYQYATGGAIERINRQRYLPLNMNLAKAIIEDRAGDDTLEAMR